jgi:hypothetical protein
MTRPVQLAILLAGVLAAGKAAAGIDTLASCGYNWGGTTAGLGRGRENDVTVTGFGVDLATSVDSSLSGATVSVVSRKNGFGSNIVIRLVFPAVGPPVDGTVTLHYFGGGTDTFNVSVSAGPTVTSVAFAPENGVSTSGGTPRITSLDPHVVVLKGTNLDALSILGISWGDLREPRVVLQLPGELRVSFKADAGERSVGSALFQVIGATCGQQPPFFTLGFTVFDPPRTPTPTATPTATRTSTPISFRPIAVTPGALQLLPPRTPTPTPAPAKPKGLN